MLELIKIELGKRENCTIPKHELNALQAVIEFNLGLWEEARQMLVLPATSPF